MWGFLPEGMGTLDNSIIVFPLTLVTGSQKLLTGLVPSGRVCDNCCLPAIAQLSSLQLRNGAAGRTHGPWQNVNCQRCQGDAQVADIQQVVCCLAGGKGEDVGAVGIALE